ncbi:hypothetical protein [Streptomyces sp. FIT100]|uniref:hypothetical protein n=1 Tax=Streptomyces sp. FIT100 TaxID=2837956 RepID=UPI0021C5D2DD|nr:hypothetical protein [Streptomyces sp. FIT100]UUN27637.1 hypothetical protein KK483_15430 [Streptomyces sp. FIT100]
MVMKSPYSDSPYRSSNADAVSAAARSGVGSPIARADAAEAAMRRVRAPTERDVLEDPDDLKEDPEDPKGPEDPEDPEDPKVPEDPEDLGNLESRRRAPIRLT